MAERPQSKIHYRVKGYIVAVLALVTAFFALPTPALSQDLYAVTGILVDERADNEVQAKQIGITRAKRRALQTLIDRLTLTTDQPIVNATDTTLDGVQNGLLATPSESAVLPRPVIALPDDDRLEFMLRDVSFQDERFGGGRYLATMTIRFQEAAVNQFLQRSGAAYLVEVSPRAVILPIFRDSAGDQLWSETNPWLDAWWGLEGGGLVVPYSVPLGDLADISAIDVERALAIDGPAINAIAARYRAGAVIIALATFSVDGGVLVELSSYGAGWPPEPELLNFSQAELMADLAADLAAGTDGAVVAEVTADVGADAATPPDPAVLLGAAAARSLAAIEDRWKRTNILRFDQQAETVTVAVNLSGIQDWLSVRRAFDTAAPIKSWRLSLLAVDHAEVEIDYVGEIARLGQALARSALILTPAQEGEGWILARQ